VELSANDAKDVKAVATAMRTKPNIEQGRRGLCDAKWATQLYELGDVKTTCGDARD
jgi:hypothetical protein